MDYHECLFMIEHERMLREKHKLDMEEKSKEMKRKNSRGRTIISSNGR